MSSRQDRRLSTHQDNWSSSRQDNPLSSRQDNRLSSRQDNPWSSHQDNALSARQDRLRRRPARRRICEVRLASVPLIQLWRQHDARCLNLCVFFHTLSMVGEQVVLGWYIL